MTQPEVHRTLSDVMETERGPSGTMAADLETLRADIRVRSLRRALENAPDEKGESKVRTLRNAIFELIERGFWRPGDKIPGEKYLCILLSVSLGTVQSAMRDLVASGLIERRRGRGSFIADAQEIGSTIWHFRFRTPDGASLLPWAVRVIEVTETREQGSWSDFLGGVPSYIRIRRIVRVADEFNVYSEVYLEGARFRPLLDIPLDLLSDKNLRVFLHERYNAPTFRAVHRLTACHIPAEHAELIGCAAGSQGLDMKALSYTFREAPISFQRIIVPKTPYELEILG